VGSLEDYLNRPENQHKRNWPFYLILRQERFISILNARERGSPYGSGAMYQTFTWIEPRVCPYEMVYTDVFFSLIEKREIWEKYQSETEDPPYLKGYYGTR
jgi:hypothetical protein